MTHATQMPNRALAGPAAWRGDAMARSREWLRPFTPAEIRELEDAVARVRHLGLPIQRVRREDFPLPALAGALDEIRAELLHGRGFVLLRGLPLERYARSEVATMFWGIGTHLGTAVPQNAAGHLLGHVTDMGYETADPHVRMYQTNERQGYHTDSADIVGLLCLRPARTGGLSSLASCSTIHNAMLERCPDLLEVLFEPFQTDHRGEYRPGTRPYFVAPVLNWFAGELSVLYQRRYIESARRFPEVPPLTPRQVAALDAFEELLDGPALHLQMKLEPGDIQLIHNLQLIHDRTAFQDGRGPHLKRHLLRLWLSPPDGRALPQCFAERYGSVEAGRRGGVVLPGVEPCVPLIADERAARR